LLQYVRMQADFQSSAFAVKQLLCHNTTNPTFVRFFFCQYDNPESLKARTILGSLIRQCLDINNLSNKIEGRLKELLKDSPLDFEELNDLIEDVFAVSQEQFIVIDALDECEKADRKLLLSALRRLINASKVKLKIFLTSGPHMGIEFERTLRPNFHISMTSPEANSDIRSYIENEITQKNENGDLMVGQSQLITEIQDALVRGAQGM
jgi:hypothetical protein